MLSQRYTVQNVLLELVYTASSDSRLPQCVGWYKGIGGNASGFDGVGGALA